MKEENKMAGKQKFMLGEEVFIREIAENNGELQGGTVRSVELTEHDEVVYTLNYISWDRHKTYYTDELASIQEARALAIENLRARLAKIEVMTEEVE